MSPERRLGIFVAASAGLSGLLAVLLGYETVWGGTRSVFLDYVLPVPVATGALHVPSLFVVGSLAAFAPRWSASARAGLRIALVSLLAAGAIASLKGERWADVLHTDLYAGGEPRPPIETSGNPLGLFLMSDAIVGLGLSLVSRDRGASGDPVRTSRVAAIGAASLALPAASLAVFQPRLLHGGPPLEIVASYTVRPEAEIGLVYVRSVPRSEAEWDALAAFGRRSFDPGQNVNTTASDVLFFDSLSAATRRDDGGVIATLCLDESGRAELRRTGFDPCLEATRGVMRPGAD